MTHLKLENFLSGTSQIYKMVHLVSILKRIKQRYIFLTHPVLVSSEECEIESEIRGRRLEDLKPTESFTVTHRTFSNPDQDSGTVDIGGA